MREALRFQLSAFSQRPEVRGQRSGFSRADCIGSVHSSLITHHSSLVVRAFSMIELLIAIMILGLGLVMLATVFPVGFDMTRDTVEKHIAMAVGEHAVATVELKVPTWHDELA